MLHKCGYPLVCGDLVAMEEALKERITCPILWRHGGFHLYLIPHRFNIATILQHSGHMWIFFNQTCHKRNSLKVLAQFLYEKQNETSKKIASI